VHTVRAGGAQRVIPIADFHRLPGDAPQLDSTLEPGELITHVTLPPPPPGQQVYRKVRDRASYAFAMVSVAAISDGRGARIAMGGVAHKPWRDAAADTFFAGRDEAGWARGADVLLAGARGFGHNDFKIPLARRTIAAALREANA
jgi:xanthine dehydrogenase YagS FAD-binding subunit